MAGERRGAPNPEEKFVVVSRMVPTEVVVWHERQVAGPSEISELPSPEQAGRGR